MESFYRIVRKLIPKTPRVQRQNDKSWNYTRIPSPDFRFPDISQSFLISHDLKILFSVCCAGFWAAVRGIDYGARLLAFMLLSCLAPAEVLDGEKLEDEIGTSPQVREETWHSVLNTLLSSGSNAGIRRTTRRVGVASCYIPYQSSIGMDVRIVDRKQAPDLPNRFVSCSISSS